MSQIKGVSGNVPDPLQAKTTPTESQANRQTANLDPQTTMIPVGPTGEMGQPVGLPLPGTPGQNQFLPDVLTGRDPSQLNAAQLLRESGGVSATDKLLGLDKQPTILGAFAPPPGNSEALRHMTPTMRRTAMRLLLSKQREKMRRLAIFLQEDDYGEDEESQRQPREESEDETALLTTKQHLRARDELQHAAGMIDLLEELLAMQDYTISQMGTFSKG
jgi:hypothetical protein